MSPSALRLPLSLVLAVSVVGQERLFRPEDRAIRAEVAEQLAETLRAEGDLPTTVALAAVAGTRLPAGSAARAALTTSLQVANAAPAEPAALARLRSELGDLVAVLGFEPKWEAELPTGFPGFGAVGELELRRYPAYRMARTSMRGGSNSAFWPLFRHIKSNDIAMTTPVQMDWQDASARPATMAFLYGDPAIEPGATAEGVEVVEVPAQLVLSIGAIGDDREAIVAALRARLQAYADAPGSGLEVAGPIRTMGYNSPMVRRDRRYFEVQLPVRRRASM